MATGNVITLSGKKIILNRLLKAVPDYTPYTLFKVGTGTTTPVETDTDLEIPVIISGGSQTKTFSSSSFDETNLTSEIRAVLLTTDANGNYLTEFGVFNNDGTKKCFSHAVYLGITKNLDVQVIYTQKDKIA